MNKGIVPLYSISEQLSPHVETVMLLARRMPDSYVNVKVEFGDGKGQISIGEIARKVRNEKS